MKYNNSIIFKLRLIFFIIHRNKITVNFRLGDILHNYADISKINKLLGFVPKYNFKQGLKLFTIW